MTNEDQINGVEATPESPTIEPSELEDVVQIPTENEDTQVESLSRRKKAELKRKEAELKKKEEFEQLKKDVEAMKSKESREKNLNEMVEKLELGNKSDTFKTEFNSLVEDGLTEEKAKAIALKLVGKTEREMGRSRATLPPTSTTQAQSTVYTKAQLEKLASTNQAEYSKAMNAIDDGKAVLR